MSITQTGSTQSSATNIALRQCSNNNFITAGQILTDSVTKAYSIGNGACYRITMNRSNPKDTNGFGFGNGVTTVNITLA